MEMLPSILSSLVTSTVIITLVILVINTKFSGIEVRFSDFDKRLSDYQTKADSFNKDVHRLEMKMEIMLTEQKFTIEKITQLTAELERYLNNDG